jgi:ATPase subunit of ABC transporter with duplicated ATPase domains
MHSFVRISLLPFFFPFRITLQTHPPRAGRADKAQIDSLMRDHLKFDDIKLNGPTSALSGGWRMKLALARCILIKPDIMLLDEPTNHLDHATVNWFIDRLRNETHATVLVVSHDTGFLDAICTDIIHVSFFTLRPRAAFPRRRYRRVNQPLIIHR